MAVRSYHIIWRHLETNSTRQRLEEDCMRQAALLRNGQRHFEPPGYQCEQPR
jgi:hypothetical protein